MGQVGVQALLATLPLPTLTPLHPITTPLHLITTLVQPITPTQPGLLLENDGVR